MLTFYTSLTYVKHEKLEKSEKTYLRITFKDETSINLNFIVDDNSFKHCDSLKSGDLVQVQLGLLPFKDFSYKLRFINFV